jgi:hypothetical protein
MSNLRAELERITSDFVSAVLSAMRTASLNDLAAEAEARGLRGRAAPPKAPAAPAAARPAPAARPAGGGRRRRASPAEVQRQKDIALTAAKQLKGGFSKGDVMKKSGSKVDLGRALSLLVSDGKLTKKGDRRLTRYWIK